MIGVKSGRKSNGAVLLAGVLLGLVAVGLLAYIVFAASTLVASAQVEQRGGGVALSPVGQMYTASVEVRANDVNEYQIQQMCAYDSVQATANVETGSQSAQWYPTVTGLAASIFGDYPHQILRIEGGSQVYEFVTVDLLFICEDGS